MHEDETDRYALPSEARGTDEGLGPGVTDVVAEAAALAPQTEDFDHRLLMSRISAALFDEGEALYIGKYEVLRHIGEGGMGLIYLCWDEDLERELALKCVRGLESEAARARLRREAVALARLSHDNVVQVYDSGEHEGRVYVAMEYVEGPTLRAWMDEGGHSREQILDLFLAAGEGLAAAHAQGLVHRDFKPENVLIEGGRKPKVVDFGLVRHEQLQAEGGLELPFAFTSSPKLTGAGALVGTRLYMPLEQILGEPVDARGDQFSFCMSLYEALWGAQPFPYDSFDARRQALERDSPARPPDRRELFRVIRRGLARDPDQRWPDMDALLRALERARHRRHRLAWGGLGASVALAGLAALWPSPVERCAGVEAQLEQVWSSEIAAQLDARLAELDAPHVARSRELLAAGLDAWAQAWLSERGASCEALHDSAGDLARQAEARTRDACLARQREGVTTLLTELREGEADTLAQAVVSIAALPAPASCALGSGEPEPLSPELAAAVQELRTELARAHQLRLLGERERALAAMRTLEAEARALGFEPLLARVLGERGKIEDVAGSSEAADALYLEAIGLARAGGAAALEAELVLQRAELAAFRLGETGREAAKERYAWLASYLASAPGDAELQAGLALGRGRLAELDGDRAQAAARYREAIELAGPEAPSLPAYYDNLAQVVEGDERRAASLEAWELAVKLWGPQHPRTAAYLLDYGVMLDEQLGEHEQGRARRAEAVQLLTASKLPEDRARVAYERALQALEAGAWDEVEAQIEALVRAQPGFLSPAHPDRGLPDYLRAKLAHAQPQPGAFEHASAALRAFERDPKRMREPQVLMLRNFLINELMERGELVEARRQADLIVEVSGPDTRSRAVAQLRLAELALREGQLLEAAQQLEGCAGALAEIGEEALVYELLRALVSLRTQPSRPVDALALAEARARHQQLDEQVQPWLEQLGASPAELRALGYEERGLQKK